MLLTLSANNNDNNEITFKGQTCGMCLELERCSKVSNRQFPEVHTKSFI
jgi:hypothetical protein